MSVPGFLEKDVFIRLSGGGFVETIRYFGLPDKSLVYEIAGSELADDTDDERLMFVRVAGRSGFGS